VQREIGTNERFMINIWKIETLNRGLYNYNKQNVENRNDFVFAKKKNKKRKKERGKKRIL
jgi:hypothetical protein